MSRILVACVGNIFRSDDGFGVEVAARLAGDELPAGARLEDFGIRSVHLAYELMEGYDVLVLVDTVAQQAGPAGSLYVIEPDLAALAAGPADPGCPVDAHDLPPGGVLSLLPDLGARWTGCWSSAAGPRPSTTASGCRRRWPPRSTTPRSSSWRSYAASPCGSRTAVPARPSAARNPPDPPGSRPFEGGTMLKKLMTLAVLAAVGMAVKMALPDLKRYLEMRRM